MASLRQTWREWRWNRRFSGAPVLFRHSCSVCNAGAYVGFIHKMIDGQVLLSVTVVPAQTFDVALEDEGISWTRAIEGEAADAFRAAAVLTT
jgi:hypothetical protein